MTNVTPNPPNGPRGSQQPPFGQQPQFVQPAPQPAKPKKYWGRTVVIATIALTIGIMVGSSGGTAGDSVAGPVPTETVTEKAEPAPTKTVTEKAEEAPEKAEETEDAAEPAEAPADAEEGTMSQQQALRKAESYLDGMPFSKSGLAEQLEYEGFSPEDAEWAVDRVGANWKDQAVLKALSYLESQAFSEAELVDQLLYEGFTEKQAQHGASTAYNQ